MQILGHGNTFQRVKCSFCNAELGIIKTDILTKGIYIDGGWTSVKYVICPECKEHVVLQNKNKKTYKETYI